MTEIGKYLIGKTIGEGTFGKVCKAVHLVLGLDVAVKILEKKRIVDEQDVERVKREITILQMLHHPQVVQLYEIIETETHIYMFMEYASGGELFDYIDKMKRLPEQEVCKFMHQIIEAVAYIHSLKIVHRDLKPENLLLNNLNNILVVDFGLSNLYEDTLKTACGSPCYAAPEMILAQPYQGLQTDLWSCGVIMYAMLCGYLPFEDNNTQILYKKILNAEFHVPRFVSADAKNLLINILCVDPQKRFNVQQIRNHKWWSLYKSELPPMDPFKQQFSTIIASFLPNSQYGQCVQQSIKRDISEELKTCDTDNINAQLQNNTQKINANLEKQILNEIPEIYVNNSDQDTPLQGNPNFFSNNEIIQEEIIQQQQESQFEQQLLDHFSSTKDIETQSPEKQEDLLQSVRSLTRQQSLKSIQSIAQLTNHTPSQIEPNTKPEKNAQTTQFSSQTKVPNRKSANSKPAMLSAYRKPQTTQVPTRVKQGPSKSMHEAPPNLKFQQPPQTPSSQITRKSIPAKTSIHQTNIGLSQGKTTKVISYHTKTETVEKIKAKENEQTLINDSVSTKIKNKTITYAPKSQQRDIQQQQQQLPKTPINKGSITKQKTPPQKAVHNKLKMSVQLEKQEVERIKTQVEDQFNQFEQNLNLVDQFKYLLNKKLYMPQKVKQIQIEPIKGIEMHSGPVNMQMISHKHPKMLITGIQKYLQEKYLQTICFNTSQQEQFSLNFVLQKLQIEIKVKRLEMAELFIVLINNNKNNSTDYFQQFIADLITNFKF